MSRRKPSPTLRRPWPRPVWPAIELACLLALLPACGDAVGNPITRAPLTMSDAAVVVAPPHDASLGDAGPDDSADPHDVPNSGHCAQVVKWSRQAADDEEALMRVINGWRATNPACGGGSSSGGHQPWSSPPPPLEVSPELRCSARLHSQDMAVRGYFTVDDPGGKDPGQRMTDAGFAHGPDDFSELIGQFARIDASNVLNTILQKVPRACTTLADRSLTALGVGRYGQYLTIDLAGPP